MERIKNVLPCTDTTTPASLGLKHLATRPKKQQLIEDRHQEVAKENKKLMERMTKIMAESRVQKKHERHPSLREAGRKLEVDRVNFENNLLLHRLKVVVPVLNRSKMEQDYARHLQVGANMRRKQMPSLTLKDHGKSKTEGRTFDASSYTSQFASLDGSNASPIKSMAEFRKHVITAKRLATNANLNENSLAAGNSQVEFELSHTNK